MVVMEGGRVDEEHSGPPDKVLPWLQMNMSEEEAMKNEQDDNKDSDKVIIIHVHSSTYVS